MFTGKERDAETGLDFFEARYYSAAQGRFTSPDEFKGGFLDAYSGQMAFQPGPLPYADISDPQTLNKYLYVRNNPLRYTDPDGHCIFGIDTVVCAYVAVTAAAAATGAAILYVQTHKKELTALVNTMVDNLNSSPSGTSTQPQDATGPPPSIPTAAPASQIVNATAVPTEVPGSSPMQAATSLK